MVEVEERRAHGGFAQRGRLAVPIEPWNIGSAKISQRPAKIVTLGGWRLNLVRLSSRLGVERQKSGGLLHLSGIGSNMRAKILLCMYPRFSELLPPAQLNVLLQPQLELQVALLDVSGRKDEIFTL